MALILKNGKLNRFVITISFSLALALGTNITIANASMQSTQDNASIRSEQTTPNNDNYVQQQNLPKTVSGVIVTVESDSQLDLKWTAVEEATSYKIYRSTKRDGNYKRIGTSTTNSFSDEDCKAKATYYYRVSAVNEMGEGKKSNEVIGITKVPEKVTNLSVAVISDSQLDLSWKAVKGVTSYEIYRSSSSSGVYTHISTSTTTSYSDEDCTANSTYYYKVSAVNGVGEGVTTSAVLGETKVPGQVTGLRVKVLSETQMDLSWKAVNGALSYEIYCSSRLSGNYISIGTSTTTGYRSKGLKDNTLYFYKVSALNGVGEGTMSSAISKRTE